MDITHDDIIDDDIDDNIDDDIHVEDGVMHEAGVIHQLHLLDHHDDDASIWRMVLCMRHVLCNNIIFKITIK